MPSEKDDDSSSPLASKTNTSPDESRSNNAREQRTTFYPWKIRDAPAHRIERQEYKWELIYSDTKLEVSIAPDLSPIILYD